MYAIRKKDINSLCTYLEKLEHPFCVVDASGKMLYRTTDCVSTGGLYAGQINFEGDTLGTVFASTGDVAATLSMVLAEHLKAVIQRRELSVHTLFKYEQMGFLTEVAETLGTNSDLRLTLAIVTEKIAKTLQSSSAAIMVYTEKNDGLFLMASFGDLPMDARWRTVCLGVRAALGSHDKAIIANDSAEAGELAVNFADGVHSLLFVPLKAEDREVGFLALCNKDDGVFNSEDGAILVSVSVMIANSILSARLLEERIRNERFSAIGQMASGIIHDIKNPLTTIKGFAGLMGGMEFTKEERKEYCALITTEVDRLVNMINDILAFTRGFKTVLDTKTVRAGEYFSSFLPIMKQDLEARGITLVTRLDYDGNIVVDEERFKRVVFNIAGNAREEMHNGGSFLVLTRPAGGGVEMVFADTGAGIPGDIVDTLFEPFVTRGKKSGTGLGLAITKKIVEELGGSIRACNGPYSGVESFTGANFVIVLPMGEH